MFFLQYVLMIIRITPSASATKCVGILKASRRDETILGWVEQRPRGNNVNAFRASPQTQINIVPWIQYKRMSISKVPSMENRDQSSRKLCKTQRQVVRDKFWIKGNVLRMKQNRSQQLEALEQEVPVRGSCQGPSLKEFKFQPSYIAWIYAGVLRILGAKAIASQEVQTSDI